MNVKEKKSGQRMLHIFLSIRKSSNSNNITEVVVRNKSRTLAGSLIPVVTVEVVNINPF